MLLLRESIGGAICFSHNFFLSMDEATIYEAELITLLNDFSKEAESFVKKFETFTPFDSHF